MWPSPPCSTGRLRALWPILSGQGWTVHSRCTEAYTAFVRHAGLPNFLEARVPLPSSLNVGEWRRTLLDHPDRTLADHVEFGFLSNYSATCAYAHHVTDYVRTELREGALLTPLQCATLFPLGPVQPHHDEAKIHARQAPDNCGPLISPQGQV